MSQFRYYTLCANTFTPQQWKQRRNFKTQTIGDGGSNSGFSDSTRRTIPIPETRRRVSREVQAMRHELWSTPR